MYSVQVNIQKLDNKVSHIKDIIGYNTSLLQLHASKQCNCATPEICKSTTTDIENFIESNMVWYKEIENDSVILKQHTPFDFDSPIISITTPV